MWTSPLPFSLLIANGCPLGRFGTPLASACTSLGWLVALGITVAEFLGALERQVRLLDLLRQRMAPASGSAQQRPAAP